ncbi:MAG: gamma-glutamylcyclotransferase [Deltaproteobacteria bacterium]|nr:MAG: gamma-glutamylcyclotransferase [Deltaproteobacteria bacterium]
MTRPLFVYGTLMEKGGQGGLIGHLPRRPATMRGSLWRMPAGYPALRTDAVGEVHGELVELTDEAIFRILDAYEGVDEGLYQREVRTAVVGLVRIPAWVYVMRDPEQRGGTHLPSGRWRPIGRSKV